MQKKLKLNPDKEKVKEIRQAIKKSGGYCPCAVVQNEHTKCQCLDFRTSGECHCGLFISASSDDLDLCDVMCGQ